MLASPVGATTESQTLIGENQEVHLAMKKYPLLVLALLLASTFVLDAETRMETSPISGDDLVSILDLNVQKTKITFDTPKKVSLRWESGGSSKEFPLEGVTKSVSLMTYVPAEGGPVKPLRFWLAGEHGRISSSFSFDSVKAKFWRSQIVDGVFTTKGSETEEFTEPLVFRLQILTQEK